MQIETTPIENVIQSAPSDQERWLNEYLWLCRILSDAYGNHKVVEAHKQRLGKQARTVQGEYRMWVWETDKWRVYVSNIKGICFEVPVGVGVDAAWEAWQDYRTRMGGSR